MTSTAHTAKSRIESTNLLRKATSARPNADRAVVSLCMWQAITSATTHGAKTASMTCSGTAAILNISSAHDAVSVKALTKFPDFP